MWEKEAGQAVSCTTQGDLLQKKGCRAGAAAGLLGTVSCTLHRKGSEGRMYPGVGVGGLRGAEGETHGRRNWSAPRGPGEGGRG